MDKLKSSVCGNTGKAQQQTSKGLSYEWPSSSILTNLNLDNKEPRCDGIDQKECLLLKSGISVAKRIFKKNEHFWNSCEWQEMWILNENFGPLLKIVSMLCMAFFVLDGEPTHFAGR